MPLSAGGGDQRRADGESSPPSCSIPPGFSDLHSPPGEEDWFGRVRYGPGGFINLLLVLRFCLPAAREFLDRFFGCDVVVSSIFIFILFLDFSVRVLISVVAFFPPTRDIY